MKLLKYLIALILALFGIASPWEDIDVSDLLKTRETAMVEETDAAVFEETELDRLVEETMATVEEAAAETATEAAPAEESVAEPAADQSGQSTVADQSGQTTVAGENETTSSSGVNIDPALITSDVISFTTTDLAGNTVTSDIFGDYDLTLVHIWGTYCGPCLREIGSYGDLYRDLPENVNMIGLVCDVYDGQSGNVEYAKQILADTNVTFQNLRISTELYDVLYSIDYVPSSFFVDRDGHLIGQMLDGVGYESTVEVLNGYIK
jgi:thiol-disulfide isomerase/thioredoxin